MFRRQCVNVIDTTWGRICFLTCEDFGRKFRTQCAVTLTLSLKSKGHCTLSPKFSHVKKNTKLSHVLSITFTHCLRKFNPSKKIRIRFDFLRFCIRSKHFDRKGWRIRKPPKKRIRKFRTRCARTLTLLWTNVLYLVRTLASVPC